MKKNILIIFTFCLLCTCFLHAQQAKYVFYFIGDGMGMNQVQMTELYTSEIEDNIGITPLLFTQFPYSTVATTFSATNGVTDSAASGTALASGTKTSNGAIGMMTDLKTPLKSIAALAKEQGCRVGIATSVAVNHATPAAFYAHNEYRKNYNAIGRDLVTAGFDFYGGADFWSAGDGNNNKHSEGLYDLVLKNGYAVARGYKDYQKKAKTADKMILLQNSKASLKDSRSIPFAIDRRKSDLTLVEITRAGINFLTKEATEKGFFLMIEGGKIDWACHSNDAATIIKEVQDFDKAIGVAYEFYEQHPEETLIVVTADHETGGLVLGTGNYELNLKVLKNQKISESEFTNTLKELRRKHKETISWKIIQNSLKEYFGFWEKLSLTEEQEQRLKAAYEKSFVRKTNLVVSEYQKDENIAMEAKKIINEIALVGWTSGGHSAGCVPVFAIGVGADSFQERTDNTEIPIKIAQLAGYNIDN